MGKFRLNTSVTVFILFFGIALLEAFEKHNWLEAALFLLLGAVSLWADRRKA
jgi:uncharacterized membrane protein (DUF485 family)